jgi:uncharacterized repeat protein (TIGR03803 family)
MNLRETALRCRLAAVAMIATGAIAMADADAGQVKTLVRFGGNKGVDAQSAPVLASDGNYYGTTTAGGDAGGYGTIYRMSPSGHVKVIHSFDGTDGMTPYAPLVQASDGRLYGSTTGDGQHSYGTLFSISLKGDFTLLHSFSSDYGEGPGSALIQGSDGNLYGTTSAPGGGIFFSLTTTGQWTALAMFDPDGQSIENGSVPSGPLLEGDDGNFYGTAAYGGANYDGTIFRITPTGTISVVHTFSGDDGMNPVGGLALTANHDRMVGAAVAGGTTNDGTLFQIMGGEFTKVHDFDLATDGSQPSGLVPCPGSSSFHGTLWTSPKGVGTVFEWRPGGRTKTIAHLKGGSSSYPPSCMPTGDLLVAVPDATNHIEGTLEEVTAF